LRKNKNNPNKDKNKNNNILKDDPVREFAKKLASVKSPSRVREKSLLNGTSAVVGKGGLLKKVYIHF